MRFYVQNPENNESIKQVREHPVNMGDELMRKNMELNDRVCYLEGQVKVLTDLVTKVLNKETEGSSNEAQNTSETQENTKSNTCDWNTAMLAIPILSDGTKTLNALRSAYKRKEADLCNFVKDMYEDISGQLASCLEVLQNDINNNNVKYEHLEIVRVWMERADNCYIRYINEGRA